MTVRENIGIRALRLPHDAVFSQQLLGRMTENPDVARPTVGDSLGFIYPLLELTTARRIRTKIPGKSAVNDTRALYLGLQGDYDPITHDEAVNGSDPNAWSDRKHGIINRHKLVQKKVIDFLHTLPGYTPDDIQTGWSAFKEDGTTPVPEPIDYPQEVLDRRALALRQPVPDHMFVQGLRSLKRILAPEGVDRGSIIALGVYLLNVYDAESMLPRLEESIAALQPVVDTNPPAHDYLAFALAAPSQGSVSGLGAIIDEVPMLDIYRARTLLLKSLAEIASARTQG